MLIAKGIYEEIVTAFSNAPVESGGILGRKNDVICKFFFDDSNSSTEYRIRAEVLNPIIAEWAKSGILFLGIIHSHPNQIKALSKIDKAYAEKLLVSFPHLQYVIFPVITFAEGKITISSYRFDGRWRKEKLIKE